MRDRIGEYSLAIVFFWILALLVVPLPASLLDVFLSFSFTLSLLVLLIALYATRPLDFSVFPSLLLIITMLRLGLNVASTRLILLHGADGSAAAGSVIRAFGTFTVGGNYTVGVVVFLIFVVINLVVITKGSGRIAEVAARFTLDAMPGKQMAIDADLNQGVIDDETAMRRRSDIQREADFYGAMDGASKFVKGDATAGLLITAVNILGGLFIGAIQEGMPLSEALETYTLLTVGDGLVSQVPALVVSTAAGVVVSRAAAGAPLADELRSQIILQPRPMALVSGMLGALALVPGLPFFPFASMAVGGAALAWNLRETELVASEPEEREVAPVDEEADVASALALDELELEIGYGLIPLVDADRGGELLNRIKATRRQLAIELGFLVPLIHIRDNLQLEPSAYSILLRGNAVARGDSPPGRWLAIKPGDDAPAVPGIEAVDPAFGLPAIWVQERDRERANALGYAVVDASTTLATHLAEVIRVHAADLLSRQHVKELLDQFALRSPSVVEEIVPNIVSVSVLHRTLRSLLAERVSIRDIGTILETLAEFTPRIQDADLLTDLVRERLARTITRPYMDAAGTLNVITLAPDLDEQLRNQVNRTDSGSFLSVDPVTLDQLVRGIENAVAAVGAKADGVAPTLLCSQSIRSSLFQIVSRVMPRLTVLSHNELPNDVRVVAQNVVSLADAH